MLYCLCNSKTSSLETQSTNLPVIKCLYLMVNPISLGDKITRMHVFGGMIGFTRLCRLIPVERFT